MLKGVMIALKGAQFDEVHGAGGTFSYASRAVRGEPEQSP
jgi:hypothetical protein